MVVSPTHYKREDPYIWCISMKIPLIFIHRHAPVEFLILAKKKEKEKEKRVGNIDKRKWRWLTFFSLFGREENLVERKMGEEVFFPKYTMFSFQNRE